MTFEKLAYDYLFNNCMFENDAKKVIELAKKDEVLGDTMQNRWSDDTEGYPQPMLNAFIVALDYVAVKYIDDNIPMAWFRPMFAGN